MRKTFGKPICEHQAIQLKLGEMATRARAARLLTLDAARRLRPRRALRHGGRHGEVFRLRGGAGERASKSMRIHGAYGYSKEYDIERLYRDAPLTCIGEGTNEMQRIIIAKQWIKRNPAGMKPLQGVRILAVEQFGAAPYGTMLLADLGAEVIKIENAAIGGDPARKTGPYLLGDERQRVFPGLEHQQEERRPRPASRPRARRRSRSWSPTADALVNNLRGDQPAKLGLDYKTLSAVNPKIVCVHISAYGRDNERAAWPGYDYPDAGRSRPDEPHRRARRSAVPVRRPSIIDSMTGMTAAVGLLSCRDPGADAPARAATSTSRLLDVALHQLGYVGDLVSQRRPCLDASAAQRAFFGGAGADLSDRGRLDLHHVHDATSSGMNCWQAIGRDRSCFRSALCDAVAAAGQSRRADRAASMASSNAQVHGVLARQAERRAAGRARA